VLTPISESMRALGKSVRHPRNAGLICMTFDRCYSTAYGEVRRIVRIENGKVTYTTVGRNIDEVPWSGLTTVATEKFAREVVRQAPNPDRKR